jgi:hypothetical protein
MVNNCQRILLIAPLFNLYHLKIKENLQSKGFEVDFIQEKKLGGIYDLMYKLSPTRYKQLQINFLLKQLNSLKHKSYSHLFIVRGEYVDTKIITFIKKQFNIDFYVSYQWDSVKNNPVCLEHKKNNFKIFSFDRIDCDQYSFNYLPLFYSISDNDFNTATLVKKYAISSVGVFTKDRLSLINQLIPALKQHQLSYFFVLKISPVTYLFQLLLNKKMRNFPFVNIRFSSLKYNDTIDIMKASQAVLDICHTSQSGLTMRTIECVGLNVKIITNNENVKLEPFFNRSMINVCDNFDGNYSTFLQSENIGYSNKNTYSLDSWLDEIIR